MPLTRVRDRTEAVVLIPYTGQHDRALLRRFLAELNTDRRGTKMACQHCGGETRPAENYCSWACHVQEALAQNGARICPNGLPVRCVRADGVVMEHMHADVEGYLFPVEVDGEDDAESIAAGCREYPASHAFLGEQEGALLTVYEFCEYRWRADDGTPLAGHHQYAHERLSKGALDAIQAWREKGRTT